MKPGRRRLLLLYGLPLFLLLLALNSILHSSSTIKEQAESAINNNNLRYLVMIDAGSSGSRVQIYSYYNSGAGSPTPPTVLNGNQTSQQWEMKVTPGISTLAQQQPSQWGEYFLPLIEFAHQTVPKSLHSHTPVYLMATAGMRLLPASQQQQTLFQTCMVLYMRSS
jgi:Golgi nucleoside diphosphatase